MKGVNTLLGWLLMLAVLAIPSFLFYNWWSKNKVQGASEAAMEAPAQDVFSKAEQQSQVSSSPLPAAALPTPAAAATVPAQPAPLPISTAAAQAARPLPAQAAAVSTAMAPAQLPEASKPAQPAVSASTGPAKRSFFAPKGVRNPMLSAQELQQIKDAEEARLEAERQARMSQQQVRKPKDMGIENRIRLQGVVGNAAIINGDMYYVGQSILGGKLLKVTDSYIIMEYKGKTFRKTMQ